MLTGRHTDDDDDGATVLSDGLSVYDDDEAVHGRRITSAQAAAARSAARTHRYLTLFLLLSTLLVSLVVASIRFGSPRIVTEQQQPGSSGENIDVSNDNGLREEENALRLEQTLEYLKGYRVSHWTALDYQYSDDVFERGTGYSPQYRAAVWIARHDLLRIAIPQSDAGHSRIEYPFLQRYSLAVLFFSLGGLDPGWMWRVDFLRGFHECDWHDVFVIRGLEGAFVWGAVCDGEPDLDDDDNDGGGLRLSKSRVVTAVSLPPMNNMQGTLPPEIHHLRYLKTLHIQHNKGVSGTIPFQYGWLEHMSDLALQYTSLEGKIPRTFANLKKLKELRLEQNMLRGNTLDGDLDFIKGMEDLTILVLDYNGNITGTLPDFSSLSGLEVLSLSNTGMFGMLPSWLSQLTQLRELFLDDCAFEGSVGVLQTMTNLTHVYLEDNWFDDTIDETFFADSENLVHLDVSNCSFIGSVPGHLFNLPQLEVLDMSLNNLTGVLPELPVEAISGVQQSRLEYLSLHSNNITGSIPQSIWTLHNLTTLDLSMNELTGDIPIEIGDLYNLQILFLGRNNFNEGRVPGWLRGMTQLTEVSLKDSSLIGEIPPWLGELTNLTFLDLGENDLINTIPQSLGNLTELMVLILNSNRLRGELGLGQLANLETILIDDNELRGNTDPVCAHKITHFVADCAHGPNDALFELELNCTCCTLCCHDENVTCNDSEWLGNHKGIWEYGYKRRMWDFEAGLVSSLIDYD